jgi:predicted nucleotidyltransferase
MRNYTVDLREVTRRIVEVIRPLRVILFGSRAVGRTRKGSDWDFLVIANSKLPRYRRAAPLYGALSDIPAQMDILVYTPSEVKEWRKVPQAFVTTALRQGRVLYEKP